MKHDFEVAVFTMLYHQRKLELSNNREFPPRPGHELSARSLLRRKEIDKLQAAVEEHRVRYHDSLQEAEENAHANPLNSGQLVQTPKLLPKLLLRHCFARLHKNDGLRISRIDMIDATIYLPKSYYIQRCQLPISKRHGKTSSLKMERPFLQISSGLVKIRQLSFEPCNNNNMGRTLLHTPLQRFVTTRTDSVLGPSLRNVALTNYLLAPAFMASKSTSNRLVSTRT